MTQHSHKGGCCHDQSATPKSVYQTLDEMDFERGLWSAAVDGDLERVQRFLLDKKVDPDVLDKSGLSPLHYACRNGHENIVKVLLQHGANPNMLTRCGQATPLHRAAYAGHLSIVNCLLKNGAVPSLCDDDGKSPLHKAAERGQLSICQRLLEAEPTLVNILDKKGRSGAWYVATSNKELQHLLQIDDDVMTDEGLPK